ncbi:MAG: DEAD/DEAH box helicase [Prolixibacteraceae bacterium]|nr:DEAD/DEAH box helicase [Prolixibacteraceae bacterium]MBN2650134.1 DEAD/DEAH box helicase [Prolixibacteraceae bacterium]
MRFDEFDLHDEILEAISYMGFEKASPIQEKAIPLILENKDLLAFAQTGTGKTAAFILPILDKIAHSKGDSINTLIIVPTRELAIQIDQQIQGFSYFLPTNSIAIYGGGDGSDWVTQSKALKNKTDIIVATPGKLISHLNVGNIKFEQLQHLVLDEADRMLDMGFYDDIQRIVSYLPKKRQTLLFSATMPPKIKKLSSAILDKPEEIAIELSKPAEKVLQAAYLCSENHKTPFINHLINQKEDYKSILIFTSTKAKVNQIVRGLKNKNYQTDGISSDLEQSERENVLSAFKAKRTRVLVATDVISRGIDIKDIELIINYDVPGDAEDYVHRVGRTARAESEGVAVTLINENDMFRFKKIEELIETEIIKLPIPPEIGKSPEWNPKSQNFRFKNNQRKNRKK